jgi:hypothetical protein
MTADVAALRIEDFAAQLDATFEMQTAAGPVPLRLAKVDPAGNSGRPGGAFSLLFVAPPGPVLPQQIYCLSHPVLGAMDLFLVPVGPAPGGNGYQAVFT